MPRWLQPCLVSALIMLSLPFTAEAVPICPTGTMADYLALDTCRVGVVNFSDFTYAGSSIDFLTLISAPILPESVSVTPFGTSGTWRLTFAAPSLPFWHELALTFNVSAPSFIGNRLAQTGSGLGVVSADAFLSPGGVLHTEHHLFPDHPEIPLDVVSFDPISSQHAMLFGFGDDPGGLASVTFDVVTPEPTTLLLWGTGTAAVGAAGWWKGRRSTDRGESVV